LAYPWIVIAFLIGVFMSGLFRYSTTGITRQGQPMSDHDRTAALVQRWAHMGAKKPHSSDQLANLWSSNEDLAFWPDACQVLTSNVQTAFPERPGLAKGDLRVKDFNDPKNPAGRVKTVDDLAKLVLESPAQ
jgi:hypothetical protein